METEDLEALLEDAGLSPYQARAYVALLDLGTASATQLAESAQVPAPRIYDVVRDLEQEGYVETYEQGSLQVRAHSPAEVLEDLRERAENLETAAEEIDRRWEQPDVDSPRASIVQRFQTVYDHAREMIEEAESQVQLSVSREQFEGMRGVLEDAHDRGVFVRVSLNTRPDEPAPDPETFEGVCMRARHRPIPAPFITLVDRTKTCFAPHEDSVEGYGVIVDDQTHAYVFHWFFLSVCWELWDDIYLAGDEGTPVTYVDLRQCVRDLEPRLRAGESPSVAVEGVNVRTGEEVELAGRVVGTEYESGPIDDEGLGTLRSAGRVTMRVQPTAGEADHGPGDDGGGEEVTVGGWGAVLEDVEAMRITVG